MLTDTWVAPTLWLLRAKLPSTWVDKFLVCSSGSSFDFFSGGDDSGSSVLGPACSVSAGGMLGISKMPFWCLDTTTGPWHSHENTCTMLPSPHLARRDSKGQREHGEGDIGVCGHNI